MTSIPVCNVQGLPAAHFFSQLVVWCGIQHSLSSCLVLEHVGYNLGCRLPLFPYSKTWNLYFECFLGDAFVWDVSWE